MSELNGKGPENTGSEKGRTLGNCIRKPGENMSQYQMGQGMGKRRKAGLTHTNKIK